MEMKEIDGINFPVAKSLSTTRIKAHLTKMYRATNKADVLMLVKSRNRRQWFNAEVMVQ